MHLSQTGPLDDHAAPLSLVDVPDPEPGPDEVVLRVTACGVCHTELDEIEGRTPPPRLPVIPGHEVVGRVQRVGRNVRRLAEGDRVGVGWIHSSTGGQDENLSPEFRATGRDVDGGYAQYLRVPEDYAFEIPDVFADEEAAPLLCAGAVGYRALRLTGIRDGDPLGLTGFGGSAHLLLSVVRRHYPRTHVSVFARSEAAQEFARSLGAHWAGHTTDRAPQPLQAVIDTTPAWRPVVEAMANLRPGGRLVINAIRKEDTDKQSLMDLSYHEHLWMERELKTVANVAAKDIRDFLQMAAEIPLQPVVQTYRLEDANRALCDLKFRRVRGAKVLVIE